MHSNRISDLPEDERPREKLAKWGAASLSTPELIAIFLRVGVKGQSAIQIAQQLIHTHGSLHSLSRLDVKELSKEHGLGPAKAAQIAAAFEIGIRLAREKFSAEPLNSPELIYEFMRPQLSLLSKESLFVILVDTRIQHVKTIEVSRGSVNETLCHPRDVLHPVVLHEAYGFILVHNHPSGNPNPSSADNRMTEAIKEAANLLQVRFIDHIIVGSNNHAHDPYFSYREAGML
ncbi:DNA repair protein RadC [Rubritalea squalenifaciens DSM 18772]|uniref:DNA repair protein RadC n=1 Tax=Rubritalea squalenifaciens DSM 18772 TaxID=1123071 RepID=A0A1M6NAT3_9BACT|nr:DNA repair protein RadC [Rubritalea squalenifaciens]SHJ92823.1 DNA repair protein RadC [Rubritalea squalenifaciens DSM 18772]